MTPHVPDDPSSILSPVAVAEVATETAVDATSEPGIRTRAEAAQLIRRSLEAAGAFAPPVPSEVEVAGLLDRWLAALRSGHAENVVSLYAPGSVLLPTLSGRMRTTREEQLDYFRHFLAKGPQGGVDRRVIQVGPGTATDIGHYTFFFATGGSAQARYTFTYSWDGQRWLIASHHSSVVPE